MTATVTEPSGCRWCGIDRRNHFQRWTERAGWHGWAAPTLPQIKARMLYRRFGRMLRQELRAYAARITPTPGLDEIEARTQEASAGATAEATHHHIEH